MESWKVTLDVLSESECYNLGVVYVILTARPSLSVLRPLLSALFYAETSHRVYWLAGCLDDLALIAAFGCRGHAETMLRLAHSILAVQGAMPTREVDEQ